MEKKAKIFVAGHKGLVGSALVRRLQSEGYENLLLCDRQEVDLTRQVETHELFKNEHIDYVFLAAAKVGGILYNNRYQADFLYENLLISCNVIHAAAEYGVKKLLFLGSSCIYPKFAPQPIPESALLSGPLEPTNEGYALSKIAGLKLCEKYAAQYGKRFTSAMPTNLYGPGDNFHPEHSHVIPALLRRIHEAKTQNLPEVVIWGTGTPRREFLHVDDLARALLLLMQRYEEPTPINIGTGEDLPIADLAALIAEVVGYKGKLNFDATKPDGTPRKVVDATRIHSLGWRATISLQEGLRSTYAWALDHGVFSSPSSR